MFVEVSLFTTTKQRTRRCPHPRGPTSGHVTSAVDTDCETWTKSAGLGSASVGPLVRVHPETVANDFDTDISCCRLLTFLPCSRRVGLRVVTCVGVSAPTFRSCDGDTRSRSVGCFGQGSCRVLVHRGARGVVSLG